MAGEGGIITHQSVAAYFKEQLDGVCTQRRVTLTDGAGFYVVSLLSDFSHADRLFLPAEDARHRELAPLADLLARAAECTGEERARILKHLGDSSLYVGGFFQDALERHHVDVDYYVSMGGQAYAELSSIHRGTELRSVFAELAEKFGSVMELLTEMAEQHVGLSQSAAVMLRSYEKWLATGSQKMAARLRRAGLLTPVGDEQ